MKIINSVHVKNAKKNCGPSVSQPHLLKGGVYENVDTLQKAGIFYVKLKSSETVVEAVFGDTAILNDGYVYRQRRQYREHRVQAMLAYSQHTDVMSHQPPPPRALNVNQQTLSSLNAVLRR
uniref:Pepsin-I3 domain-containing protein n=1 Tax=Panagrellus redivivus TaxID=6233 RepID=A0A7E4W941_PANRE